MGTTVGETAPGGHLVQGRHLPLDGLEQALGLILEPRDRAHQTMSIGMARVVKQLEHVGLLHRPARIHHNYLVTQLRHHPEIVGDEDDGHAGLGLQLLHQLQDLGLDGHIQRRGRLVADEQRRLAGERHGDHHPLAHAAGEVVGIDGEALGGLGDPHLLQHGDGRLPALGLVVVGTVEAEHLHQLIADRLHRVERRHRLLKDHRDAIAAHLVHLIR